MECTLSSGSRMSFWQAFMSFWRALTPLGKVLYLAVVFSAAGLLAWGLGA